MYAIHLSDPAMEWEYGRWEWVVHFRAPEDPRPMFDVWAVPPGWLPCVPATGEAD